MASLEAPSSETTARAIAGNPQGHFLWRADALAGIVGPFQDRQPSVRLTLDDPLSGRRLWTRYLYDDMRQSDVVIERQADRLYVLIDGQRLRCFDALTGAESWSAPLELLKPEQPGALADMVATESIGDDGEACIYAVCGGIVRGFEASSQRLAWELDLAEQQAHRLLPWRIERRGELLVVYPGRLHAPGEFRFAYVDPAAGQLIYRSQPFAAGSGDVRLEFLDQRVRVQAGDKQCLLASRTAAADVGVTLNEKE